MAATVSSPFRLQVVVPSKDLSGSVPPPGNVAAISGTSHLEDLNPVKAGWGLTPTPPYPGGCVYSGVGRGSRGNASAFRAVMGAWGSGCFAYDCGPLGAYVIASGGDGDWWGNDVYIFPFAEITTAGRRKLPALRWSYLNRPSVAMDGSDHGSDPYFNGIWGEHGDGTPVMPHVYDQMEYLSASLGGGPKGAMLLPTKFIAYRTGKWNNAHRFDIDASAYSRASTGNTNFGVHVDQPSWVFDSNRKRYYGFESGGSSLNMSQVRVLDFRAGSGVGVFGGVGVPAHKAVPEAVSRYWAAKDLVLVLGLDVASGGVAVGAKLHVYNPASWGAPLVATLTGDAIPPRYRLTFDLCTDSGDWYVRSSAGGDEQSLWRITPPANPLAGGQWVVTKITMGGAAVVGSVGQGLWKRFFYHKGIKCFVWCSTTTSPVYAYRPVGT